MQGLQSCTCSHAILKNFEIHSPHSGQSLGSATKKHSGYRSSHSVVPAVGLIVAADCDAGVGLAGHFPAR